MWLQFTRRTDCQIPFTSYTKISSKVRLIRRIKNREIFLVQIATRPFPKHIYRSLKALLNSTLIRNEFGSFQTQTIHKIEGSKPYIYSFYTKTRQIHTIVQKKKKSILFHTKLNKFNTHIVYMPVIFFSFPSFFSSFLLLLFSSLFFSLFLFLWITLNRILKRRKLPPSFLHATCPFLDFFSYFSLFLFIFRSLHFSIIPHLSLLLFSPCSFISPNFT